MRVLIFEPQFMGHNLVHVARLVRGVRGLGCEAVVATSRQAIRSAEFALHLAPLASDFRALPLDGFTTDRHAVRLQTGGLRGATRVYQALKSAIARAAPDHVYVPYGNFLARIAAAPFGLTSALRRAGAEAETLIVGGRYLYPRPGLQHRWRQWLLLEAISRGPWRSVFHLDDAAYGAFQRHGGRMARVGKLLPEPVGEHPLTRRVDARHALGLPGAGRLLAVIGLIERRKGLDALTSALRQAGGALKPTDRLALIGPQHPEVTRLLSTDYADLVAAGRVVCVDRRLTEADMVRAACAADVVAAVYPHHPYASGSLVVAARARRPVLGSSTGWIRRTIDQFQLGRVCDPADAAGVCRAVVESLAGAARYQPSPAAERLVEFVGDRNYIALWTARLRRRMGLGPSPDMRSWDWALGGVRRAAA
ncbi:MAG: hypothetical protein AAF790_02870 [Planctomycetota bacterium]